MQVQQTQPTVLEIAEALAPGWERRREFVEEVSAPVRDWMVRELAPRPGDTVLELAAGAGDTGYEAAVLVGPTGRLISTDFSPAMVDVGRRRLAEVGLDNVEVRVMDAEHIELDADSVDGVLCRFGYMLMSDPLAALRETRRVLRPGGRLALAVWGAPERNPYFAAMVMTLAQAGHIKPPQPGDANPFSMASADGTRDLLERAGFERVRTEEVPVRFRFRDVEQYVEFTADTAGPIALALRALSDDERAAATSELREATRRFQVDGALEFPGVTLAAVAS